MLFFRTRPSYQTSSAPASTDGPVFPVPAVEPPSPGPLPRPPDFVSMPTPYKDYSPSMTMMYALQGDNAGPPSNHLYAGFNASIPGGSPPIMPSRPVSAPDTATVSQGGKKPTLQTATPPRIGRASSAPTSPTSAKKSKKSSDAGDDDENIETCGGMTKAGKRCTRKVKTPAALDALDPSARIVRFCHQHEKEFLLSSSGFYAKKPGEKDKWVVFDGAPEFLPVSF